MKALVIIPVFNEGIKLQMVADRMQQALVKRHHKGPTIEVLIMDDGSSSDEARQIAEAHHFHYLRNEKRQGVGYAIRRAYDYGLAHHFDFLVTMAGNNKDNPEEIDRLLSPLCEQKADLVQGSRYLAGGNYGNMPPYRMVATRCLHPLFFSALSGKRMTDSTNGFRALRASLLRDARLDLHQDWLNHYELEPYLLYKAIRLGYRVLEVPVTKIYPDKRLGYSKMKPFIGWWSILRPLVYLFLGVKQ